MKIITLDREFGSGGRELGKRLADALKIPCYDNEIIEAIAKMRGMDPWRLEGITREEIERVYSSTIARRFMAPPALNVETIDMLTSQEKLVRDIAAQGSCLIVGRCADVILEDLGPMNIFVYASRLSKLRRCCEHMKEGETEKTILRQMKLVDYERAAFRQLLSDVCWGETRAYNLCINTTGYAIKDLIPPIVGYVNNWFALRSESK